MKISKEIEMLIMLMWSLNNACMYQIIVIYSIVIMAILRPMGGGSTASK